MPPYGSVTEWLIDTDACFDVVVEASSGCLVPGTKDPPGMGGDFYGSCWNYQFTHDELQIWTIPTAELTASWMGVLQTYERTRHAAAVCMQIDALASPRVLTSAARSNGMVEVHQEIMAHPKFKEIVNERRALFVRHLWGHANPGGDCPSRQRWRSMERLCWQLKRDFVREEPCEEALAFQDRVARRLLLLRERDVAAPGGDAIRSVRAHRALSAEFQS